MNLLKIVVLLNFLLQFDIRQDKFKDFGLFLSIGQNCSEIDRVAVNDKRSYRIDLELDFSFRQVARLYIVSSKEWNNPACVIGKIVYSFRRIVL